MNKKTKNLVISEPKSDTNNTFTQRKKYSKPELTNYGDISELVLMIGGDGTDAGPKFASLT